VTLLVHTGHGWDSSDSPEIAPEKGFKRSYSPPTYEKKRYLNFSQGITQAKIGGEEVVRQKIALVEHKSGTSLSPG